MGNKYLFYPFANTIPQFKGLSTFPGVCPSVFPQVATTRLLSLCSARLSSLRSSALPQLDTHALRCFATPPFPSPCPNSSFLQVVIPNSTGFRRALLHHFATNSATCLLTFPERTFDCVLMGIVPLSRSHRRTDRHVQVFSSSCCSGQQDPRALHKFLSFPLGVRC